MPPIAIENLPPFEPIEKGDKRITGLSSYLGKLLEEQDEGSVQLPSLERMAGFFQSSQLDVLDALQHLHRQGVDYQLQSSHLPIQLWITHNENKKNKE